MKEMMDDAGEELARKKSVRKARSSRSVKTNPSEKAMNSSRDSSNDTTQCNDTPVSDTAVEEENKNEALVGGVHHCDGPQVDPSCSNNTRPGPRKVRRKAPPPPRPALPRLALLHLSHAQVSPTHLVAKGCHRTVKKQLLLAVKNLFMKQKRLKVVLNTPRS